MRRTITADQLGPELRRMARSVSKPTMKIILERIVGHSMVLVIRCRFLTGKGPNGKLWKSPATETKFGNRFSKGYDVRPSGIPVTASSLRLVDTGETGNPEALCNSFGIKTATHDRVFVSTTNARAGRIASRAEKVWKNSISGWDSFAKKIAKGELTRGIRLMFEGFFPEAIPKADLDQIKVQAP